MSRELFIGEKRFSWLWPMKKAYHVWRDHNLVRQLLAAVTRKNIEYDHIYLLTANLGETFLFSKMLPDVFRKNKTKFPLLIGTLGYHKELHDAFIPDVNFLYIEGMNEQFIELSDLKQKNIYNYFNIKYFYEIEVKNKNFYEELRKRVGLREEKIAVAVDVPDEAINSAEKKLEALGVKKKKFLLVSPESYSSKTIDVFFSSLCAICEKYKIDVVANCMQTKSVPTGAKCLYLNFMEALHVASRSQAVVGLRSGLMDMLAFQPTPQYAIYTDFKYRGKLGTKNKEDVLKIFSLKYLPTPYSATQFEFLHRDGGEKKQAQEIFARIFPH